MFRNNWSREVTVVNCFSTNFNGFRIEERKQPERPGKLANSIPHCDSAIGNHLLHNQKCASHYKDNQFFILSKARSDFHLSVLESISITLRKPNLCIQKEFVYKHKLLA